MPDHRRAQRRALAYLLAIPVIAIVYLGVLGTRIWSALRPAVAVWRVLRDYLFHPTFTLGGRLIDRLPERLRPPIRHRDRRPHLADWPGQG